MASSFFRRKRLVAAKMTINQAQPWYVKLVVVIIVLGLAGAVAAWTYDMGRSFAFGPRIHPEQLDELKEQIAKLTAERDKLLATANTIESQQNINKTVQKELTDQVKTLTTENMKLKDDLAFFETIVPTTKAAEGISVQGMKAEMVAPNQLSYRILVMQGGKGIRDFSGEMQITLTLVQAGKPAMMFFPDPKLGDAGRLKLTFKHYQRLEGLISIPEGAVVKAVQAKVLDHGQQRAQQSISL